MDIRTTLLEITPVFFWDGIKTEKCGFESNTEMKRAVVRRCTMQPGVRMDITR
jgi:hypothetical protein